MKQVIVVAAMVLLALALFTPIYFGYMGMDGAVINNTAQFTRNTGGVADIIPEWELVGEDSAGNMVYDGAYGEDVD